MLQEECIELCSISPEHFHAEIYLSWQTYLHRFILSSSWQCPKICRYVYNFPSYRIMFFHP